MAMPSTCTLMPTTVNDARCLAGAYISVLQSATTALMTAAKNNDVDVVESALAACPDMYDTDEVS